MKTHNGWNFCWKPTVMVCWSMYVDCPFLYFLVECEHPIWFDFNQMFYNALKGAFRCDFEFVELNHANAIHLCADAIKGLFIWHSICQESIESAMRAISTLWCARPPSNFLNQTDREKLQLKTKKASTIVFMTQQYFLWPTISLFLYFCLVIIDRAFVA